MLFRSYPGPVFVRTADGCAYQANVDVDGIESSYGSSVMSASLKATEVQLTSDFMVASSDVSFPEGEEPQPDESLPERQQILAWGGDAPQASMQFTLYEEPHGNVAVTLQTNYDEYMEAWTVPATNVGTAVTLSEFGADLVAYIQMVSNTQSPQFLLKAHYDIEGA